MSGHRAYDRRSVRRAGHGYGDASATTPADFLDPSVVAFAEPPDLAAPADPWPGLVRGDSCRPAPPAPASTVSIA
jgi:hypothetical protein